MKHKALKRISAFLTLFLIYSYAFSSPAYDDSKRDAEKIRSEFALRYDGNLTLSQKEGLLTEVNLAFQKLFIEQLMPPWYGTKWAFHGTSQTPGEGSIACGYFVTTLLRDAGVKLERVSLAQQASENIIKSLVSKSSIRRFSNKPLTSFLNNVSEWGDGLYIVGLDFHVGFISVENGDAYFIHSSYQSPYAVTRDVASESAILASSKYRVVGKLGDEKLINGWLKGIKFKTVGS